MTLDDKLGPIARRLGPIGRAYHRIDDEVHRYYEKVVKKAEAEGVSRKTLWMGGYLGTTALSWMGFFGAFDEHRAVGITQYQYDPVVNTAGILSLAFNTAVTLPVIYAILNNETPDGCVKTGDQMAVANPMIHKLFRFAQRMRLTQLAFGVGFTLAGGAKLLSAVQEQNADDMHLGFYLLDYGVSGLMDSSIAYLIDKKPELLDKAPAWRQALDSVREYFTPAPAPAPVPVPVQNYRTTDVDR